MRLSGLSDRYQSLLVMVIACGFCMYQFLLQATPGFIAQPLMDELGLSRTETGVLGSSLLYTYVLLQVPGGMLVDRFGVRNCFIGGLLFMMAGTLVFSGADSLISAIIGRMLQGAGSSVAIVGALCLAAAWFPSRYFPLLVGLVEMSAMMGGVVCGALIPELLQDSGWRGTLEASALLGVVLLVATLLWVRNAPKKEREEPTVNDQGASPPVQGQFLQVLGSRQVWVSAGFGFGLFGLVSVFGMMWGVSFLACLYPDNASFPAQGMALFFAGVSLGTVLCGWLASRGGSCRNTMILGSTLTLLLLLSIVFMSMASALMAVVLFCLGLVIGSYGLAFVAPEKSLPPSGLGVALAFINAMLLVAGQILQPLLGSLLDMRATSAGVTLPDYQVAFVPLLALAGIALVSSLLLRRA
ncbi:MFS transporter [Parendozoicomonas haliclonae]|uniref:Lysosomal dipeptide transporter MFSD1 n=1 Tax=Parendozoicomonas haliclonae TaxID=1960125 RepID=A0A1X7AK42_9GAMM|nr:MFS transporter [Parendozoicomonas haliclonae]SMA47402.1 putative glucarate transporter [Parendozoicomonas haliclonae]